MIPTKFWKIKNVSYKRTGTKMKGAVAFNVISVKVWVGGGGKI